MLKIKCSIGHINYAVYKVTICTDFSLFFHFNYECPYLLQQNHKKNVEQNKRIFSLLGTFFLCRTIVGLLSIVCRHIQQNTVTIIFQICLWHFCKESFLHDVCEKWFTKLLMKSSQSSDPLKIMDIILEWPQSKQVIEWRIFFQ